MRANFIGVFASMLAVTAALLAIRVVRSINARKEERYKRLTAAAQPQPWSKTYSASVVPPNVT